MMSIFDDSSKLLIVLIDIIYLVYLQVPIVILFALFRLR